MTPEVDDLMEEDRERGSLWGVKELAIYPFAFLGGVLGRCGRVTEICHACFCIATTAARTLGKKMACGTLKNLFRAPLSTLNNPSIPRTSYEYIRQVHALSS